MAKNAVRIIKFIKNSLKNIGTDYSFKNWHYIITGIKLHQNTYIKEIYLNTKYFLTLINRA